MRLISCALLLSASGFALAPAAAQPVAEAAADEAPAADIVVFGRGESRQVQELGRTEILVLTPGTSPLKAIEKLPGVNFQSADAFGAYEWSQRVSIRSFNQNQIGFTFDGVPLGDGSYGNNNGLHISRAISSENVGRVRVSQGAGSIGTQATNNLGGTIETFSSDPLGRFGVQANATYGSADSLRGFLRVDLGQADGPRGYVSYGYASTDKWKGEGKQLQHQANAKVTVPLGAVNLDGWYSFSRRAEQDYHDLSLEMIGRLGYDWDNFGSGRYALALQVADVANNIVPSPTGQPVSNAAAGSTYPAPLISVDDAYFDASGIRRDHLAYLGLSGDVGAEGNFLVRGYYHNNKGQGLWGTPYVSSPTGVPISIRTTEYAIDRYGLFGSLSVPLAGTDLTVGGWYERTEFTQARRFYALASRQNPGRDFRKFQSDPFFTQWEYDFTTKTLQYFVQDRIDLGRVTVNVGWKGYKVTNEADPVVAGALASGRIKVEDWFQPHVGFAAELGDQAELFGGFTQVTRAFVSSSTSGPFATTQAGFNAIRDTLEPETSDTWELGVRFDSGGFNGVLAGYYINFRDRLLGLSTSAGIIGNPAVLQNVGSVRSVGFEAAGEYRFGNGFSAYVAYAYNDATYRNNVVNAAGAVVARTQGRMVVDSPEHILRGELAYDQGPLFGRIGGNYMSKRFFNYENDRAVPGRVVVDATLGFRIDERFEVQLNGTNLFDKRYVATIGSNGFGNRGDNQTLLAAPPRQLFATLKTRF